MNRHTETEEGEQPILFRPDQRVMSEQVDRLSRYQRDRGAGGVDRTRAALRDAAATDGAELMPAILDAVRAEATLGEICGTLREVFGEYRPPSSV